MRIRKKLIFLHTLFSLGLAAILIVALRPAILRVIQESETHEARLMLSLIASGAVTDPQTLADPEARFSVAMGSSAELGLDPWVTERASESIGEPMTLGRGGRVSRAVVALPDGQFAISSVHNAAARRAVFLVYALMIATLLAAYALVAAALELFVLPQHVYGPIRRMLRADQAVREGRNDDVLIDPSDMPADELGELMKSRNDSFSALRRKEEDLEAALAQLEDVANDLKRKNHLLEAARKNLRDADRLASLGMMSAGIAHEINTPLAVLMGLIETLNREPVGSIDPTQAVLMKRVAGRLERVAEGLLDFARVRQPRMTRVSVHWLVDEAMTLVRLDRSASQVTIENHVPEDLDIDCDADRMIQVLVNLLRNAADATAPARGEEGRVCIDAMLDQRDDSGVDGPWVSIRLLDNGSGIDPELLPRLFDPFVSTRLDANGTGLGLAVAHGIVKEHGGLLLARNHSSRPIARAPGADADQLEDWESGAEFEILLPAEVESQNRGESSPASTEVPQESPSP